MTENECLGRMVAPGQRRPGKPRGGVIQILVTSSCDLGCYNCTQGSNLARKPWFMTPDQFEAAADSLKGYFGVVGVFGGNPALSKHFPAYCEILRARFPREQLGVWCNHPRGYGKEMARTFDPGVSNLNVHLSREAYDEFKRDWPASRPFGLDRDSRHSPVFVAMRDVLKKNCGFCGGTGGLNEACTGCADTGRVYDVDTAHDLISKCDVNQHWSAGVGVFRGELRAWFCEIAMSQSILHQDDPAYPDTGIDPTLVYSRTGGVLPEFVDPKFKWWQLSMNEFSEQVRKHCHDCGVPLRGHGSLAQAADGDPYAAEQVSDAHLDVYRPKRAGRRIELVTTRSQLGPDHTFTKYLQHGADR